jgi:hypothetical protein
MDEAHDAAVVKVLLVTDNGYNTGGNMYGGGMYGNGAYNNGYGGYNNNSYEIKNFQENLIRNLRYQGNNEFVQFYTDWDARSNNIQPDEIVEMRLGRIDMGRSYDESYSRDASARVVVRQIVYKPDSVVNEYKDVYARINVTRRNFVSGADLDITARDAKGNYLWSDVVRGEHRFSTEFATYTGDERALSASDRSLINNTGNNAYSQVRREDILKELLRQVEYEASNRFKNYYSRYY